MGGAATGGMGGKGAGAGAGGGSPASTGSGMTDFAGGTSDPYYTPNVPYSPDFASSSAFTDPMLLAPESLGGGQAPWQAPGQPDQGGQQQETQSPQGGGGPGGQGTAEQSQGTTSSPEVKAIADAVSGGNQQPVGPAWFQQKPGDQQYQQGGQVNPGAQTPEAVLRAMAGVPQPAATQQNPWQQTPDVDPATSTGLPAQPQAAVGQTPTTPPAPAPEPTPAATEAQTRQIGRQGRQGAAGAAGATPPTPPGGAGATPQQGFNPLQAITDLLTKGPQAFIQDLQGLNRQVGGNYGPENQYSPQAGAQPSGTAQAAEGGRLLPRAAMEQARANRLAQGRPAATAPVGTAPVTPAASQSYDPTTGQPVTPTPPVQTVGVQGAPGTQSGSSVAPAPPGSPQVTSGQAPMQKPDGSAAPTNGMPGGTTASAPMPTEGYGAAQDQKNRPRHYTGKITVNGHQYDFGSGGGQFASAPYGRYHVHPGAIGSVGHRIGAFAGISDSDNPGSNTVNDPLYSGSHGHAREGLEIHPDVSHGRLVTNGCIGIAANQAKAFGRDLAAASRNGPVDLVIGPNGAQIVPSDQGANVAWTGQGAGAMPNWGPGGEPMRTTGARTRGDRNNNPGNIKTRNAPGQVGVDNQGHAIFRNREDGDRAQADLLRRVYKGQTIPQIGRRYAQDKNWARGVMKAGGYGPNDVPDMDSPEGMARLQRAIQIQEGTWHGGPGGGGSSGGAGATASYAPGGGYGGGDETTTPQAAQTAQPRQTSNLGQIIQRINTQNAQRVNPVNINLPTSMRPALAQQAGINDIANAPDQQSELMHIIRILSGAVNNAGAPQTGEGIDPLGVRG